MIKQQSLWFGHSEESTGKQETKPTIEKGRKLKHPQSTQREKYAQAKASSWKSWGGFNEEVARLRKNFWMSEPIPWFSDLAK